MSENPTIKERLAKVEALVNHIIKNDLKHIKTLLYGILGSVVLGFLGLAVYFLIRR